MTSDPLAEARQRVHHLRDALAAAHGAEARLIETHISWVLLAGTLAWKLKKPVQLPFLDFRSLEARRHFCEEELRLNRRLAPGLYEDVVEIREDANGPHLGGEGALVDAAVHMHRFADGALWSERLVSGTLEPRHIDAMAIRLAAAHASAAPVPGASPFGSAGSQQRVTRQLLQAIETALPASCASAPWPELRDWLDEAASALAPAWDSRRLRGRVRECHGDLHLANVIQLCEAPNERARFAALARRMGAPFSVIDCRAPMALLRERIAQRRLAGTDPSEADEAVLDRLAGVAEPLDDEERDAAITVDTAQPPDARELAQRWAGRMGT